MEGFIRVRVRDFGGDNKVWGFGWRVNDALLSILLGVYAPVMTI